MKVAITRPKERSGATIKLFKERGWEALIVPTLEIVPREGAEITSRVGELGNYDWLVLTSAFGAEIIHDIYGEELKRLKIAAIGPGTEKVLKERGIEVNVMPKEYKAENLVEEMKKAGVKDSRVLIARASKGREVLVKGLGRIASITEVPLYDTEVPKDKKAIEALVEAINKKELDAIIFTSSQSAKNLFNSLGEDIKDSMKELIICAIGPITAHTLEQLGLKADVMPKEYTVKACLEELEGKLRGSG